MTAPPAVRGPRRVLPTAARVGGYLVAGAVTGLASVAVHDRLWGLPLLALASLAGLLALPAGWTTRLPAASGWSLLVLAAVQGRPEGDRAVVADGPGWFLVALAAVLPLLAITTAWSGRRPAPRGGRGGGAT